MSAKLRGPNKSIPVIFICAYSLAKYLEPLIGPDTINTLPIETLIAYGDHGHPKLSLDQNVSKAYRILNHLSFVGINLNTVTQQLDQEGVENFCVAFNRLRVALKEKQAATAQEPLLRQEI